MGYGSWAPEQKLYDLKTSVGKWSALSRAFEKLSFNPSPNIPPEFRSMYQNAFLYIFLKGIKETEDVFMYVTYMLQIAQYP